MGEHRGIPDGALGEFARAPSSLGATSSTGFCLDEDRRGVARGGVVDAIKKKVAIVRRTRSHLRRRDTSLLAAWLSGGDTKAKEDTWTNSFSEGGDVLL